MSGKQRKLELSVPQIVGSALAALTAAVAASYLGVAGTVIGAAMMSLASTIAADVYTHYLKRTGDKVKQHTAVAWHARAGRTGRKVPWGRLGAAAAVVFAVSMGSILIYQVITDRTVADQVAGRGRDEAGRPVKKERRDGRAAGAPRQDRTATRSPSPTPSPTPSATPVTTPTSTSTPTVTPTPTPVVTGSPGPSAPATPDASPSDSTQPPTVPPTPTPREPSTAPE